MSLTRRRFLTISAGVALAGPARAATDLHRHRFRAFGADCRITLPGSAAMAREATRAVEAEARRLEATFSLWHPDSELSRLNRDGSLANPSPDFVELSHQAAGISRQTRGAFDVTVQALWQELARGDAMGGVPVGWRDLEVTTDAARFRRPGMAATFNGIAQGFAADQAVSVLGRYGYGDVLVDLGEHRGIGTRPDGQAWRLGVAHPAGGIAAEMDLQGEARAVATSEPRATLIRGRPHILAPLGHDGPRWASVTVRAATATLADALSTAIAAMPMAEADGLLGSAELAEAILFAPDGQVTRYRRKGV